VVSGKRLVDLLGPLVAEERAADDQQIRQRAREELAEDHGHREDDQQLVADRPDCDLRMICSSRSGMKPCTYQGVTAVSSTTTPVAFTLALRGRDVVESRRSPRDRGNVID
jgi:hypothetical protein